MSDDFDKNLYDEKTNKEMKILGDFLDGKKLPSKPPQRAEKHTGKGNQEYRESKAKIGKIIDSQNIGVQLED